MSNSIAPGSSADVNVRVTALTTNPNVPVTYKTIILKKNLVNGVNTLTQEMMSATNTKYVIKYDYVLGDDITVPVGCILEFDGGSISGVYTLTGNNTGIISKPIKIFGLDITISGTWNSVIWNVRWFGAKGDGVTDDTLALQAITNKILFGTIYFPSGDYILTGSISGWGGTQKEQKWIGENSSVEAWKINNKNTGTNILCSGLTEDGAYYIQAPNIMINFNVISVSGKEDDNERKAIGILVGNPNNFTAFTQLNNIYVSGFKYGIRVESSFSHCFKNICCLYNKIGLYFRCEEIEEIGGYIPCFDIYDFFITNNSVFGIGFSSASLSKASDFQHVCFHSGVLEHNGPDGGDVAGTSTSQIGIAAPNSNQTLKFIFRDVRGESKGWLFNTDVCNIILDNCYFLNCEHLGSAFTNLRISNCNFPAVSITHDPLYSYANCRIFIVNSEIGGIDGNYLNGFSNIVNTRIGGKEVNGTTADRPTSGLMGMQYNDFSLKKPVYAWYNGLYGQIEWRDSFGDSADIPHSGALADRPTPNNLISVHVGFVYFATDIDKPIFHKGNGNYVYADGSAVS